MVFVQTKDPIVLDDSGISESLDDELVGAFD
jgi:hypothetical protein